MSQDYRTAPPMNGVVVISRRWFQAATIFLLFFCVVWDGFLVSWYRTGIQSNGPLIMFLFPLMHVAVGVGLSYAVIAQLFNRTVIRAGDGRLSVRHGPIPWRVNCDLALDDVRQLYVERHESRGDDSNSVTYAVKAIVTTGPTIVLCKGLSAIDQSRFIERELERHLSIADAPVEGEYRG